MSEPGAPLNPRGPQHLVAPPAAGAAASAPDPLEQAADGSDGSELDPRMHAGAERLQGFMAGALPAAEMRQVLRHLLQGCRRCQELARETWNLSGQRFSLRTPPLPSSLPPLITAPPAPAAEAPQQPLAPSSPATGAGDTDYDAALDRVFSRITLEETAVEAARRRGESLFAELMQHPPAHQEMLVHNSARFRDRMLCESLLAGSYDEGFREPAAALRLARLAVAVAERLATLATLATSVATRGIPAANGANGSNGANGAHGANLGTVEAPASHFGTSSTELELLAGLRARSWAQVGNALRIGSDHAAAATAFQAAEALLVANPRVGLIDKAKVLDLKASLCKDRRQFADACSLLDRVIAIYRRLGQSKLMGRAISQKAMVLYEAADPKGCLVLLHCALELIDPHEDPRAYLSARHNLAVALVDDGRPREAFALLFHTRPLYLKTGDRLVLLRLRYLEGKVAYALHRLDQAEAAFRDLRDAYVDLGKTYDVALVSLDLAAVYAEQGRSREMRMLAEEMLVFFESRQIHREAMAAFLLFCQAAAREHASLGLVQEVAAFLKQARNTPDLRFSPRAPS
jgi:tetratricopeptide (TPR) repeat protein